jgi:hypothetical protein
MGRAVPSTEEIFRKHAASAVDRLGHGLRIVAPSHAGVVVTLISTVVIQHLVERVADRAAAQESLARAEVYLTVTADCAEFMGEPGDRVYAGVLALCGESDANLTGARDIRLRSALRLVTAADGPGRCGNGSYV